jgi:hypothetical protein
VQVAVYNMKVHKLVRAIRSDNPRPEQPIPSTVVDFCFSGGVNTHLAVIWGPQNPVLVVYKWYMGKIVNMVEGIGCFRAAFEPETDLVAAISASQIYLIVFTPVTAQKSLVELPSKVNAALLPACTSSH